MKVRKGDIAIFSGHLGRSISIVIKHQGHGAYLVYNICNFLDMMHKCQVTTQQFNKVDKRAYPKQFVG